jgi:hypothetical protein
MQTVPQAGVPPSVQIVFGLAFVAAGAFLAWKTEMGSRSPVEGEARPDRLTRVVFRCLIALSLLGGIASFILGIVRLLDS